MQSDSRISDGPDYSVQFDNFVGMKTAGRNAGRWQALVLKTPESRQRTKIMVPAEVAFGHKQRGAAERWREERDGKIRERTMAVPNTVTLHERLDRFEAKRQRLLDRGEISRSTFDKTLYGLRPIRQHFATDFPLQAIRKDTVEDFMEALLDGRLSNVEHVQERGKLGGSQAAQSLRILKTVLEDAFDNDLIHRNYARNVEAPSTAPIRVLYLVRPEQVDALVEAAKRCRPKWVPGLLATYGHTGVRKMEGASICWPDIDHDKRTLLIRGTKTDAAVRTLDLDPRLDPFLGRQAKLASRSNEFVFTTSTRSQVEYNIQRYLDQACQKAGLARLTPHMLRHSFATRLIYEGKPINEVTRIMGHANSQVTYSLYVHCWDDQGHLSYEWPESIAL